MSKANNLSDFLTDLAGAIKTKNGLNSVNAQNFKTEVNKMYGTADLETKSATPSESSQDITPSSGKVLTKVTVGAVSSTYVGSGITSRNSNSLSASDATVTVPAGYYASQATKTVASGSLANSATSGVTYTELSTPILANGWLYINKGWIGNSKISLGTLIPDITNDAAAANILAGYKAYDEAGNVLTGTMGTLSLSDTYYTTTNTGYGVVTKKLYSGASDKYIIAGSATTPATTITANPGSPTWNSTNSNYVISVSKTQNITPSVSAGWVASGTAGTVTVTGSSTLNQSTWGTGTAPSGTTPTSLSKGTTYKLTAGYYPSDRYYSTQSDPTLSGDAAAGNVLYGKTFYKDSYTKLTGTMTNNGAVSATSNPTFSGATASYAYTIPAGYHNGSGTVSGSVTMGNASFTPSIQISYPGSTPSASELENYTQISGRYFYATSKHTNTAGYVSANSTVVEDKKVSYKVQSGSATTPTESGASTSTSLSGTTLTVARSVTPTVSAGWVSSGTAGTVTITGTVPTETKSASGSGDITPSTGKLLSKVTVGAGSATPNASYATLNSAGSSATSVTSQYFKITPTASVGTAGWISSISNGTVQNYTVRSAATFSMTGSAVTDVVTIGTLSSGYYPVSAKVKGIVAASTSGWFSSSGAVQASSATQVGKIAAGTITNNTSGGTSTATINRGSQIKIGAGYYPNDLYYTAQANSGNIELTQATSTSVNGYSTATVRSASMAMPSSLSGTGASVSNSGTTLTLTKSVTNTATVTTTGWLSSLSGTTSLSLSATDANFTAENIKSGVSIFGVTGSYSGSPITDVSNATTLNSLLVAENVGKVYRYTGSNTSVNYNYYVNGCLYSYEVS